MSKSGLSRTPKDTDSNSSPPSTSIADQILKGKICLKNDIDDIDDTDEEVEQDDSDDLPWEVDEDDGDLAGEQEAVTSGPKRESFDFDQDEARAKIKILSELQSRKGSGTWKGVFIPWWAMAITADDAEQKLLGNLDYWLGAAKVDDEDRVYLRARGSFLYVESDGIAWYTVTARRLGRDLGKDKRQVHRIVGRLRDKGYLLSGRFTRRDRNSALYLRLDWEKIEADCKKAVDSGVEEDDE